MRLARRSFALALAGLPLARLHPAGAQAAPPILLDNVRYFDGRAMTAPARLLMIDGTLRILGADAAPNGAQRVDLTGRYVIPALIAAHSHIGHTSGDTSGRQYYTRENVEAQLRRYQAFGIGAAASLGLNAPLFHALRAESRAGRLPGALLLGAGPGLGMPEGAPPAGPMNLSDDQVIRPADPAAMRQGVNDLADKGIDLVKIWIDGLGDTVPQMTPDMARAAVEAAHARGLKVAAHIHDLSQARLAVEADVDVLAHGIRDKEIDDGLLASMRDRGTWYIPTIQIDEAEYIYADNPAIIEDPFLRAALSTGMIARMQDPARRTAQLGRAAPRRSDVRINKLNLKRIHDAGVPVAFGTDSGGTPLRVQGFAEHRELELMVEAGLTAAQTLDIATARSAQLLGLTDRGSVRDGLRADLVVLEADPLANIRNTRRIARVYQAGREVAGPIT
ncbi:amidohydrolase family protein [Roseomonas sp. KE2513]|uniref:amidohydrolase family protein n=1 Tax=Roseomonas sp. KE2513 TaxID=2479202 RepID=UPI0018DF76BB|nr:amidohydrolase family protein [Roseomonas sp. KE2513]MBI0539367.1 amidohydrolase family protein [Roseomonas sp. KE2513]